MYQGVPPTPTREFVKELKQFDNKLGIDFSRQLERFVIHRQRAFGDSVIVWVVDAENGGFRHPDQRDLQALYNADLWRHGGVRERVRKGEEYMLSYQENLDRKAREELRDITKDNKIQLRNTIRRATNEGNKGPEFRRIT